MLGNCERMVVISSTTNGWPQNQIIDEKTDLMASTGNRVMEKTAQDSQNQNQQALKCPRCDSSNTKFCYYNNYSLSQPRHFCKACKRYWTRGGTLRNVPVGGGCRKNKRLKRPSSGSGSGSASATSDAPASSSSTPPNPNRINVQHHPQIDLTNHHPLFYGGLPSTTTNPSSHELALQYASRFNSRVSDTVSTYDPQLNFMGLGFVHDYEHHHQPRNHDYNNNNNNLTSHVQDAVTSNSLLSTYNSIFGASTAHNSPSMASLVASSLQQQQKSVRAAAANDFHGLVPYEELQMMGTEKGGNTSNAVNKEVKMEGGGQFSKLVDWNCQQNQIHQQISSSDPSLYAWNATAGGGAWLDPANMGPSVPSLI